MTLWSRLSSLPLNVESASLESREVRVASGWTRVTTLVRLSGAGQAGLGEDVTYEAEDQRAFQARGAPDGLAGTFDLGSFAALVGGLDLFDPAPRNPSSRFYRRWALESAALDLALRQAETSLADVLEREPRPLRFVVSMGLGSPPSAERVRAWLAVDPTLEFKLDATPDWTDALCAELAATGAVRCVDLKAYYSGTPVDTPVDPALYARVVRHFGDAVIEDALWDERTRDALEPARGRLSWDAPIHSVADVEALPVRPRVLNVKPSRLGSLEALSELYAFAQREEIDLYGGGQFELDVGRRQAQELAALFHPGGANDLAPAEFNVGDARAGVPRSPIPGLGQEPGLG